MTYDMSCENSAEKQNVLSKKGFTLSNFIQRNFEKNCIVLSESFVEIVHGGVLLCQRKKSSIIKTLCV